MSERSPDLGRRELLQAMGLAAVATGGCANSATASAAQPRANGVDDIRAALAAGTGGRVVLPPGTYRFEQRLDIPDRTHLELGPGAILSCSVRDGGPGITVGNAARLTGAPGTSAVVADSTCRISSLVTNAKHDGTQEYAHLEGLAVTARTGAVIDTALVNLVSLFVNSGVRDSVILSNHTAPVGLRLAGGASTGFGPVFVDNVWVTASRTHNIVITEHEPSTGSACCWLTNVTSEHQGSGHHGLYLKGFGGLYNVSVRNFHYEHGVAVTAPTAGIYVDGVPGFSLDGGDFLAAQLAHKHGIVVTDSYLNYRTRIRGVQNINAIDPILDDRLYRKSFGARHVGLYETAGPGAQAGNADQMFVHLVQMPGGVSTLAKEGPISDADFPAGAPIPDGTFAVDTANRRLHVRIGGIWRYVALS